MSNSKNSLWENLVTSPRSLPFSFINGFKHSAGLGHCCRFHSHPSVEIVYHRSGQGITRTPSGNVIEFSEGSYILYPPNLEHDQFMESTGEDLCIQIAVPNHLSGLHDHSLNITRADRWIQEDIDQLTSGVISEKTIARRIMDLKASAILLELLSIHQTSVENTSGETKWAIIQTESYIREHFASLPSLHIVAEHLGLSLDHLRHLYKRERGISLLQFLIQIRMERAKSLLSTSHLPLKQIAPLCGYHDEYYFSAAFRRAVGQNPSKYRSDQHTVAP